MVEALGDRGPNKSVIRRAPGLRSFGTTAQSGYRGSLLVNDVLYLAFDGKLDKLTSTGGASVEIGNLNGTRRGFFAANNAATPDKVFVDPDGNIATFTPTSVANGYPDADLPAPNSVDVVDGYLVFTIADGRVFATDLNSTSVNALSFGKAEAKPDGLVRGVAWGGRMLLFGTETTEVWVDAGTTPFPLSRNVVIPYGLAGPYCVAGHESGFGNGPIWVANDNTVRTLNGYATEKLSPPDLDGLIEKIIDKRELEATAYVARGHAYWQLSSPGWTWVYDLNNGQWQERDSYLEPRSRIAGTIYAYSKWLTGDTLTGNIHEISSSAYDEVGSPLRLRVESGPVMDFPAGEVVGRADFYFSTGIGDALGPDPSGTKPQVEVSWSDDGGLHWSNPVSRDLGVQANGTGIVSLVSCTGRSRWQGRRWRLDISSPTYASFMFATQSTDPRAI
jgi:hypothetical protein